MNLNLFEKYILPAKFFLVPCFHVCILFLVYKLLYLCSFVAATEVFNFKQWDAYFYADIAENGYQYSEVKASNSGFFPFFPYEWKLLWKFFDAGVAGVCLFNTLVFFAGMLLLKKSFNFSWACFLLFVSIPSNMFMYVPYTESTFFFFSTLILSGLKTERRGLVVTGLFLAALTRPTALFFIPAILCMEIIAGGSLKNTLKQTLIYLSAPLAGIFAVVVFQWKTTGVWFAYFNTQSHFLNRTAQLPQIPFTTWDGTRLLWLDGFALFMGILCAGILIALAVRRFQKKEFPGVDKTIIFSLCYVLMAILSILFFNGKDDRGGTSLMGANRYVLATPFFTMLLFFISQQANFNLKHWLGYITLAFVLIFLLRVETTEDYQLDIYNRFYYRFLIVLYIVMFALTAKKFENRFVPMLYIINVTLQVILLNHFSYARWIG